MSSYMKSVQIPFEILETKEFVKQVALRNSYRGWTIENSTEKTLVIKKAWSPLGLAMWLELGLQSVESGTRLDASCRTRGLGPINKMRVQKFTEEFFEFLSRTVTTFRDEELNRQQKTQNELPKKENDRFFKCEHCGFVRLRSEVNNPCPTCTRGESASSSSELNSRNRSTESSHSTVKKNGQSAMMLDDWTEISLGQLRTLSGSFYERLNFIDQISLQALTPTPFGYISFSPWTQMGAIIYKKMFRDFTWNHFDHESLAVFQYASLVLEEMEKANLVPCEITNLINQLAELYKLTFDEAIIKLGLDLDTMTELLRLGTTDNYFFQNSRTLSIQSGSESKFDEQAIQVADLVKKITKGIGSKPQQIEPTDLLFLRTPGDGQLRIVSQKTASKMLENVREISVEDLKL
jgi:hypothetical protein